MPMSTIRIRPEFSGVMPSLASWSATVTAGRDEAVAAVVTGPAEDEHMLARGAELIPGDFRDGLSRVLHEIQDGDAEGLGVPIEDAHLERRDHPPRIRPSLVKRWPRG